MTKKRIIIGFIFSLLFACILISCDQDHIFATIANEDPPLSPRINGSSTNLVVYDDIIYAATIGSGTIHSFDGTWGTISPPSGGGSIIALAATSSYLYALVSHDIDRIDNSLYRYDGTDWGTAITGVPAGYTLQSIYGTNDTLFAGARDKTSVLVNNAYVAKWNVYYVSGTSTSLTELLADVVADPVIVGAGMLNGVAFDGTNYYIAGSKGIYATASLASTPTEIKNGENSAGNVTGILNVNGAITAVTTNGRILTVTSTSFTVISENNGIFTGAMSLWRADADYGDKDNQLLLLGIEAGTSYNKGYRELELDTNGKPKTGTSQTTASPGIETLSSITPANKGRYDVNFAKYNVYHILQVPATVETSTDPDWQPLIFASTTQNGVFVLRNDETSKGLWTAQE